MINNMNQEEPQVKNFFQEHGMEFSFGIWHALFAFICFWSGFLFGISEHILLGLLGALIYFVSYYVIFQYTISGTFRSVFYRKNREEGSKKARSILSFSQFFYCTFPFLLSSIIGTMTVHGEKNLFTGCLIFLDVCLFFYDFYTGLSSGFKEKILAQAESDLLK